MNTTSATHVGETKTPIDERRPAPMASAIVRGLLWREWFEHRPLLTAFASAWLICVWVLLLFPHPCWILAFGAVYGCVAGATLGGRDAAEGSEEFAFALPPTRGQQYLVRSALGGGWLLAFTVGGLLAVGYDLPQRLWGLVVESGFTEPFPPLAPDARYLYVLSFAVPVGVFAFTFSIAALARTRGTAAVSWLGGALVTGTIAGVGFLAEYTLWQQWNGIVSCTALLALAAVGLLAGYRRYLVKEGISRPALPGSGRSWPWWAAAALVFVVFFMVVVYASLSLQVRSQEAATIDEAAREAERKRAIAEQKRLEAEQQRHQAERERERIRSERRQLDPLPIQPTPESDDAADSRRSKDQAIEPR